MNTKQNIINSIKDFLKNNNLEFEDLEDIDVARIK